jgi:hypothetical protein
MDSVRITITRGVSPDGTGGAIVDDASAVLGNLPDGTPVLDAACAAFAAAYGVHRIPAPTEEDPEATAAVTPFRNLAYRLRQHANEVVAGYVQQQAKEAATVQASAAVNAAFASVQVVDHLN